MNLTISGHHLEVTPALRGYVTSKLERISRHFDQVVDIKVLLTVDNLKEKGPTAEGRMQHPCQGERPVCRIGSRRSVRRCR